MVIPEVRMSHLFPKSGRSTEQTDRPIRFPFPKLSILGFLLIAPLLAHAQGSPFDTGFTSLQTLFTGTVAKVASLIAIVIGGYGFAHGEPGAKKALAGVAAGTGIAVMAANVLSWLWGV
jgi:type IV secretion system protein VirB2